MEAVNEDARRDLSMKEDESKSLALEIQYVKKANAN